MSTLGDRLTEEDLWAMMREANVAGDGRVTVEEFIAVYQDY